MKRAGIKPTKAGSIIGIISSILALVITGVFLSLAHAPAFLYVLLVPLVIALLVSLFYLVSDSAPALSAVEYNDKAETVTNHVDQLRPLQQLQDDDLFDETEDQNKRAQIMKQL